MSLFYHRSSFVGSALDEYSRFRYVEAFNEHKRLSKTHNPTLTLFEKTLKKHGVLHKLIKPYTPMHNGKVERSHRKDNEYFYAIHTFNSFDDFKKQLTAHNRKYNHFPMRPLNWLSPDDYINPFLLNGELV